LFAYERDFSGRVAVEHPASIGASAVAAQPSDQASQDVLHLIAVGNRLLKCEDDTKPVVFSRVAHGRVNEPTVPLNEVICQGRLEAKPGVDINSQY
jgi:hypothetical protein